MHTSQNQSSTLRRDHHKLITPFVSNSKVYHYHNERYTVCVYFKSPVSFQADGKRNQIHSNLCFGAAEILPGAEKRLYEEFPIAGMKLSPGTQNGFSCSSFPQEEETFVKGCVFSDIAILRDFANELHIEII